jgi:hypothetical protein
MRASPSPSRSVTSSRSSDGHKKVGLFALSILMFYTVSGGAYGIKEMEQD